MSNMAGSIILLLTTGLPEQKEHLEISFKRCCEWERLLNQWKYCKYWLCTENASSPELCRLLLKAHCHPWWYLIQGNMCSICLFIFASGVSICVHLSMWMCVWILVKGQSSLWLFPVAAEALQWHSRLLLYANIITGQTPCGIRTEGRSLFLWFWYVCFCLHQFVTKCHPALFI